jgi:hypothetical protein
MCHTAARVTPYSTSAQAASNWAGILPEHRLCSKELAAEIALELSPMEVDENTWNILHPRNVARKRLDA